MKGLDYSTQRFQQVSVCGIPCDFNDMRIDRSTVPEGKYLYEIADDDESSGAPARIKPGSMVNFFGTLICDNPLPIGLDGVLWLDYGDFVWM